MVGGAVENETGDVGGMESGSSGVQKQVPGQNGRGWSHGDRQDVHRRDERTVVQEDPSDFCNGEKCARFCDTRSISACHRVFAMRTDYGTLRESRSGRDVQACIGAGSRCGEAVR